MTSSTAKLSGKKIAVINFNGHSIVKYVPRLRKFEDQFYKYIDGEPIWLTVYYRDEYNYYVFSDRRRLLGCALGSINEKQFIEAIRNNMKTI